MNESYELYFQYVFLYIVSRLTKANKLLFFILPQQFHRNTSMCLRFFSSIGRKFAGRNTSRITSIRGSARPKVSTLLSCYFFSRSRMKIKRMSPTYFSLSTDLFQLKLNAWRHYPIVMFQEQFVKIKRTYTVEKCLTPALVNLVLLVKAVTVLVSTFP